MKGGEGRQELFLADIHEVNLSGPGGSSVSSPRGKLRLHLTLHMSEWTTLFEKTSYPLLSWHHRKPHVPTTAPYRILPPRFGASRTGQLRKTTDMCSVLSVYLLLVSLSGFQTFL